MTDEEIEKIAMKVLELQKQEKNKKTKKTFKDIQQKYHREIIEKFGATGVLESAIRTVATYSQGKRYVAKLNDIEFENAMQVAEKLYKIVLESEKENYDS